MKKLLCLIFAAAMAAFLLAGCGETENPGSETVPPVVKETMPPPSLPVVTEPVYPYDYTSPDFFEVEDCLDYAPKCKLSGVLNNAPLTFRTGDGYVVSQGAATDGTYGYFAMCNTSAMLDGEILEAARIMKIDLTTWETVTISEPMRTCHSNGMTYNSKTNKLLVVHNKPEYEKISIVNPDTLVVEEVVTIDRAIQSIGYNAATDQYAVRLSGSWDFAILDSEFNEVKLVRTGVRTPLGSQCMTCDENYIYMLDSGVSLKPGYECITVYDWEGNFLCVYRIPSMQESEAIIICGDTFYLTFFNGNGGRLYELEMDFSLLGNWKKP